MTTQKRYSSVSVALIAISGAVALLSSFGASQGALGLLLIASPGQEGLREVLAGQVWRLVTPMFIHFGIMHFVFNMMWLWDLGKVIETRKGVRFYLLFVIAVGTIANLTQYFFTRSPFFGGMSGVVYGLFGYIWIRGRADADFGSALHKTTVVMMLAWFVLCWTGLVGPIANWAHTAGLLLGAAWAFATGRGHDVATAATPRAAMEEQVEYLSTSDMLQIEAQRQWVRDQVQPDARYRYDSVEGKLDVIAAVVSRMSQRPADARQIKSLDIALGDALVQETGARWATLNGRDGRTPVLIMSEARMTIFPLLVIARLMQGNQSFDVHQVFRDTLQTLRATPVVAAHL
ncbi:MAG: rhomboid family intramembrane serine protease [Herminiimonas sp.]|nr:rhomboid family intramembrane serine protease [Herminiimonas sp.]